MDWGLGAKAEVRLISSSPALVSPGLWKGKGVLSSLSRDRLGDSVGLWCGESGDLRGRGPEASAHNPQPQCQEERGTSPGVAVPGLFFPQMTLEPCLALAFHPRLSPDLLGAHGQPHFPLTWTGQDQMLSEGASSVTGQAGRVCCRDKTHWD